MTDETQGGQKGYILFVQNYEDGGFWGFIKPYGANGRRNNVFYTNKNVSPLVESILQERLSNDATGPEARMDVFFIAEDTPHGPRAVQVWVD